jgi:hypothetical protein
MLDVVGLALTVLDVGLGDHGAASRSDVKLGDLVHRLGLCGPRCEREEDNERSPSSVVMRRAPKKGPSLAVAAAYVALIDRELARVIHATRPAPVVAD